jgi:cellulose synthase/poly-beta-1,6-N-acetylglucosamine synthase-like glycosyltransferase
MQFWQILFFVSCFLVFFNYAGYAIIILILNIVKKSKKTVPENGFFPTVSFIVAAFNEEDFIEKKIINSLEQNYPSGQIEFIFITDGSTDKTVSIIEKYPAVKLLHSPERKGKSAALNRSVESARYDILIFSDANTVLNKDAVKNIARHYESEKTGGVAGEKKVINSSGPSDEVGAGEGLYWKYESFLKKIDSDFYSVVGAAGELFSVRKKLYEPVADNVILDDFIISLKTAQKGFRIIYEPDAYAAELPSFSLQDEQKRKTRISAGGFQSILMLKSLFKFWKHPRLSYLYISHRVLRWTLSPLCLMLAFISNMMLFIGTEKLVFKITFALQVCFYLMAALAAFVPAAGKIKLLKLPYYFTFMNVSVVLGFFRFLRGSQSAIWEKAKRAQPTLTTK